MEDKERVALAKVVIAHREHIIALEPLGKGMLGTTLRYDYEVQDEKDYLKGIPSPRISRDMVKLAEHILETKATKFNPRKFKDEYDRALKKLVRKKARGGTIEKPKREERANNVIDLMDALKNSLGRKKAGAKQARRNRKRRHRKAA
jgi:DNA end-binding protein Ku